MATDPNKPPDVVVFKAQSFTDFKTYSNYSTVGCGYTK